MTFTLEALAAATGVSARTIRYYQAEKILDSPVKVGRDAVYSDSHIERLQLIGELRDKGLTLQTIRRLVDADGLTQSVSHWLGVGATLKAPWSEDRPRTFTHEELNERLDRFALSKPGIVAELRVEGFIRRGAGDSWDVDSPALLDQALQLQAAGIDLDISATLRDLFRRRLGKAVDDTVKLMLERRGRGFAGTSSLEELETALAALRTAAQEISGVILAQEVERALAALVESGPAPLKRKGR
jgi:DNA-binding transcriptional MerR regulator